MFFKLQLNYLNLYLDLCLKFEVLCEQQANKFVQKPCCKGREGSQLHVPPRLLGYIHWRPSDADGGRGGPANFETRQDHIHVYNTLYYILTTSNYYIIIIIYNKI